MDCVTYFILVITSDGLMVVPFLMILRIICEFKFYILILLCVIKFTINFSPYGEKSTDDHFLDNSLGVAKEWVF